MLKEIKPLRWGKCQLIFLTISMLRVKLQDNKIAAYLRHGDTEVLYAVNPLAAENFVNLVDVYVIDAQTCNQTNKKLNKVFNACSLGE